MCQCCLSDRLVLLQLHQQHPESCSKLQNRTKSYRINRYIQKRAVEIKMGRLEGAGYPFNRQNHLVDKALLKLVEQLGADLVTAHALNLDENALLGVVVENRLARLLELLEASTVDFLRVISALDERLSSNIVDSRNARRIEGSVVDSARWLMNPATSDSLQDNRYRCLEGNNKVDGDQLVERSSLSGCSGETVEDKGGVGVFGDSWWDMLVKEGGIADE